MKWRRPGIGLHRVGGCTVKNEQRLPSDCVYILLQQAARSGNGGRLVNEIRGDVYITFTAGK